jgi:ATP-dependent protease ClpP protease subunit
MEEEIKNEKNNESTLIKDGGALIGDEEAEIFCLSIIGQIEGHYALEGGQKATKYDHVIPTLVALEESKRVSGILILINTLGGDVEAGLAIAEVISSMKKPTASIVLGGGHSIGVPLAVSADRSFIVPSATMTIHPVRTNGLVLGVPQAFDYLTKMQDRIISFIVSHSNVKEEYFRSLMTRTDLLVNDIGSILNGYDAVECGLIDQIGGISEAIEYLKNRK